MNIKNEHGVTILALVVTITVMVILASIAISASTGDDGLIEQTEDGTIRASISEVEEALDAYLLLKEKENIKNGVLTGIGLINIAETDIVPDDTKILTVVDTTTPGYNIYIIKDVSKLKVKGKYGKGTRIYTDTTDIFKVKENDTTKEYEVIYVDTNGNEHTK